MQLKIGADTRRGSYIPTLDGWRAISIAMVIVGHALPNTPHVSLLGALGVNIFFAISGYLICTLLLKEYERNGSISLGGFYTRRVFRILPPAMAYLGVLLLLRLAPVSDIARCLLFAANYSVLKSYYVGHFWSLSMEEHFYLFWPTALTLLRPRRAAIFAAVAIPVLLCWREWALTHAIGGVFYHRTDIRLDAFFRPLSIGDLAEPVQGSAGNNETMALSFDDLRTGGSAGVGVFRVAAGDSYRGGAEDSAIVGPPPYGNWYGAELRVLAGQDSRDLAVAFLGADLVQLVSLARGCFRGAP